MKSRPPPLPDPQRLHDTLIEIAEAAGRIALGDFRPGSRTSAQVHWKNGGSPVTDADLAVDAYLADALPLAAPLAVHSEERPESWRAPQGGATFVIDPIDGTRNFSEGGDVWCIVIGVIENGVPIVGVVHMPARQETFSAWHGGGAFLNGVRIAIDRTAQSPLRITGPRTLVETLARRLDEPLVQAAAVPALAHRLLVPLTGRVELAIARAGGA